MYLIPFFVAKLFSVILNACGVVYFFINTAKDLALESASDTETEVSEEVQTSDDVQTSDEVQNNNEEEDNE